MMKSFRGTRIDNENLISMVEDHPNLYNPCLKNYRDKRVRDLTWKKIANHLGVDVDFCQRRWRTLRDCYKKYKSGSLNNKHNRPWEYASMMSFMDNMYKDHSTINSPKVNRPVIRASTSQIAIKPKPATSQSSVQPFTSQPVIITVPTSKGLRPIAPKISESAKSSEYGTVNGGQESNTENDSDEQIPIEPEVYLVTPSLFQDQEESLFKKSLNTSKRKANFSTDDYESAKAKKAAIEEDAMLRRQESEYRLQWEEKEHSLRVKCLEEEHEIKMKVEKAKLMAEEENVKIKQQKFLVLIAKEAYFKSLVKNKEDKE